MKTRIPLMVVCSFGALSCEEGKYDKYLTKPEAAAEAPLGAPIEAAPPPPAATATVTWKKKSASDCKPHPAIIDFEANAVPQRGVARKTGRTRGQCHRLQLPRRKRRI